MYSMVKKLYLEGRIDETGLDNAVAKGWITEAQKVEIIAAKIPAEQ
jgi:hypothetical protein